MGKEKLDCRRASQIRRLWHTGWFDCQEIADAFDVSKSTVWEVLNNKRWHDANYKRHDVSFRAQQRFLINLDALRIEDRTTPRDYAVVYSDYIRQRGE